MQRLKRNLGEFSPYDIVRKKGESLPVYIDVERKEKLALLERNTHEEDKAKLEGALTLRENEFRTEKTKKVSSLVFRVCVFEVFVVWFVNLGL